MTYSTGTETRPLGRRLSNQNAFWKEKILNYFFKWNSKIQAFNYATFGNFKTVWTYLTFQETAFKFYKCYSSVCKKKYWKSLDYHYWCNWNLEMSDFFWRGKIGVPGEKPLRARQRTSHKLSPHMESTLGFEPGPHLWEASALTTGPNTNFNILVYHSL